jgi:hypothetical protein
VTRRPSARTSCRRQWPDRPAAPRSHPGRWRERVRAMEWTRRAAMP